MEITLPKDVDESVELPDTMPILPVKGVVVFPFLVIPLMITEKAHTQLIDEALMQGKTIGIFVVKNKEVASAGFDDIYRVGTAGNILKMLRFPDGSVRFLVQGLSRIRLVDEISSKPFMTGKIEEIDEVSEPSMKLEALQRNLLDRLKNLSDLAPYLSEELYVSAINQDTPGKLTDLIASHLNQSIEEKQQLLEQPNVTVRMETLLAYINKEMEILELSKKIQAEAASELGKMQREYILREQLKAIQRELGHGDERNEVTEIRERIKAAGMPEQAEQTAEKELDRLAEMNPSSAEYTVSRTYLDWLVELPWSKTSEDMLDVKRARKILDEDHYDLKSVKERIIEFLAVRRLNPNMKGPILCFVGPPGVGKTSLGRSIARAMNRQFYRLSLGGLRDEAEIRGHRRTYIGALPGRIIQGIKRAGTNNPVFMLDEVDKIGADFRGDPSSALLEVLDPEQNNSFSDHYLEVDYDLSKVMFITTANMLDPIPRVLLDRMEVIHIPGYTDHEKLMIAKRHLIPRQIANHGLTGKNIAFKDDAVNRIALGYTRESGLRNLERELAKVCRKVAAKVAAGKRGKTTISTTNLSRYLGPQKFRLETKFGKERIGEVAGLAWTAVGGQVLKIEATAMPGKKALTLTGHLGNVMKESVQAAHSFVRSLSGKLKIDPDYFEENEIHVHVPSGATPKDGPSAGITMAVALASLVTGRRVKKDVAMTGEITLRGEILPIGGLKEKLLAAHRNGIKYVILPADNRKDMVDIPAELKRGLKVRFYSDAYEAIKFALEPAANRTKKKKA